MECVKKTPFIPGRSIKMDSDKMLGFIHMTKTGGSNFRDKNQNKEIYYWPRHAHQETAGYYSKIGIKCFAILRDPVDRVTRDPVRKVGWNDRLIGSMKLSLRAGVQPKILAKGAFLGLKFVIT